MEGVGASLYKITSTEYRCAGCGTHFEIYWPELEGGKPQEAKAVCPRAGCGGEARQVRDNMMVDLRGLGERIESMERRLWPHHAAGDDPARSPGGLPVEVGYRSPLR
ncbi:MAG: hypothetical protein LYZ70_07625, partial [Nitrososphaerales archaeon]|nr:hypothetical protein [Nitrososphaerales archaeon]